MTVKIAALALLIGCQDISGPSIREQNRMVDDITSLKTEVEWLRNRQIDLMICLEWPDQTQAQIADCVRKVRFRK